MLRLIYNPRPQTDLYAKLRELGTCSQDDDKCWPSPEGGHENNDIPTCWLLLQTLNPQYRGLTISNNSGFGISLSNIIVMTVVSTGIPRNPGACIEQGEVASVALGVDGFFERLSFFGTVSRQAFVLRVSGLRVGWVQRLGSGARCRN